MNKCLNCNKTLEQTEGKKERKFCSDKCRMSYNRKSEQKIIKSEQKSGKSEQLAFAELLETIAEKGGTWRFLGRQFEI